MAGDVNYYTGEVVESHKGTVRLGDEYYVAVLMIEKNNISITIMDFNGTLQKNYTTMFSLKNIVFKSNANNFLLFGLTLNETYHLRVERDRVFNDYSYSAQGFFMVKMVCI
ncbi:hypothetical protein AF35_00880 [Enterobacter roggenkampii CHS 79]|uniref:hypothetical protein n=1 Tax=Enterobacter TaxID=547 RepID=UPI0004A17F80|nr:MULTISPECIES: hypothetical protein [Enterobacter]QLW21486.1 hypothetical protein HV184_12235 [Enterobacter cloacae]KDF59196.1 hypothetical protein AF35_00880 [Enterobacter roggenkampii CHS 79]KLP30342.1 hypothetical protein YA48_13435 [Enterobacter roggenkampii]MDL0003386.1 hypothetical protein [Enterobacter roggenkampii]MDU2767771.1 hypothetical protein [Enterobacter sp.]